MTITEHISNERPSDSVFAVFEGFIHGVLPDDYKVFLKGENGGRPKPNRFTFISKLGKTEDSTVQYFFALYDGRVGNLKRAFENYKSRIPFGCLPIATDPFGNLIILKIVGQNKGRISFWDHEEESDIPTAANVSLIANSFSEFIEQLAQ